MSHPRVSEAVVVAREGPEGEKRLVGYVVGRAGESRTRSSWGRELREYLKEKLPEVMIPSVFVELESLPLTGNGKLDRGSLPAPDAEGLREEGEFVSPREGIEEQLAGIWSRVLGVGRVGREDNFFELGGDSILSIQVVAKAASEGIRITPKQMFAHQTIERLAAVAGRVTGSASAEQGEVSGQAPLTAIQRWFFEQGFEQAHHWNQAVAVRSRGELERRALERPLRAVVRHHDALRLRFRSGEEGWEQSHAEGEDGVLGFEWVELPAGAGEAELSAAVESRGAQLQQSLDLQKGPLMKAMLFTAEGAGSRLMMVIHHL